MITAVDSNVLLDIFGNDPDHRARSVASVRRCLAEGAIVACEVVWAEVLAAFPNEDDGYRSMALIPIEFAPLLRPAAARAGRAWREYRQGGGPRDRVVADFLVGAHALEQADRLLTRDRGFHRLAFAGLSILDPEHEQP